MTLQPKSEQSYEAEYRAEEGESDALPAVRNGIDVLEDDDFRVLRNQRVAIVTNHSGVTLDGRRSIDALAENEDVFLAAIFAPEHGLVGAENDGAPIRDGVDALTGLPVYSLFGDRDRPSADQLHGMDAVLYDIQDVGCRFYTYIATLGYLLEACAENGIRVYVLDRPNPLGGNEIEGPSSDPSAESMTNYHSLPLRYGMTIGELARLLNGEREIGANLRVVTMAGWHRDFWQDQTGQRWIDPSPNIHDLDAAALYPATGLLEQTNVSVGRGTASPFHVIGAPWIDGPALAERLTKLSLPGLKYEAVTFTPDDRRYPHAGMQCNGVRMIIEERADIIPTVLGVELIRALRDGYKQWDFRKLEGLLARPDLIDAIEDNAPELDDLWQPDPDFHDIRAKYLLY
ncbi:MAG TPA: DUF1343 domain-containing protein [Candidatus Eremiobacteraceae bacterium]|nr:DUF1343 domain-containing protein [Candidatus Eremiobacteraceae bacterium]